MKHLMTIAAASAALALASPAQAATYLYEITGDYSASFMLDSNPVPDDGEVGLGFTLFDVPGFPDALLTTADVTFFNSAIDGGMEIFDFWTGTVLFVTDGPQLYSGAEDAPTMLTGVFALTEFLGTGEYTLTVTDISTGAIPEPSTWALMLLGMGAIGGAMRTARRRKTQVNFALAE